jgi:glycosyltransferase involved in cell wall biosynthesis
MASPDVTVVIPCFNQAAYLPAAIASVRHQSYGNVGVIVVDDGSTDGSAGIARRLGAMVIRQPNRGVSAARNAGLGRCRGAFVIFLDADDELLPEAVETGVAALASCPAAAAVVRECVLIDEDGCPLPTNQPVLASDDYYREWLLRNFVWTPGAAMFRRLDLETMGGFVEDVGPAADYGVYLALARGGRVVREPRPAVRYRQHDTNMSRNAVLMLQATLEVLRREQPFVPAGDIPVLNQGRRAWRQFYGEQIIDDMRRRWRNGQRGPSLFTAAWALVRYCPRLVASHCARKLILVSRGAAPSEIQPGRFRPARPPSR